MDAEYQRPIDLWLEEADAAITGRKISNKESIDRHPLGDHPVPNGGIDIAVAGAGRIRREITLFREYRRKGQDSQQMRRPDTIGRSAPVNCAALGFHLRLPCAYGPLRARKRNS